MNRDLDSIIVLPERKGKKIFLVILSMIFSGLIAGVIVYIWQIQEIKLVSADYQTQLANSNDEKKSLQKQIAILEAQLGAVKLLAKTSEQAEIISKVASLTALPAEVPVISTVTDINKFSSQALYKDSINGDKIVFFAKSGTTIIFRPSTASIVAKYSPTIQ